MLKVGDYEIDSGKIAPAVVDRLLSRAIGHIVHNECSANVLGKTKRAALDFINDEAKKAGSSKVYKLEDVTDKVLETFRANETVTEAITKWEQEYCAAKIAAMYDGTLSVRSVSAPTRDPVVAAARTIAKAEVTQVLKAHNVKFPGKDETVTIGDTELDGDTLIERRLAHVEHGPRITKLAERKVAEDRRLKDASAKAAVAGTGDGLAASLGL